MVRIPQQVEVRAVERRQEPHRPILLDLLLDLRQPITHCLRRRQCSRGIVGEDAT